MQTPEVRADPASWVTELRALAPRAVAIDVEPLLVAWHESDDLIGERLATLRGELAGIPSLELVVLVTNSDRPAPDVPDTGLRTAWIADARKPFTADRLRELHAGPWAVVGDQRLTDGLLARRLRGVFLSVADGTAAAPWWPRLQARVGRLTDRWFVERPGAPTPDPAAADEQRLQVLLTDYAETRDDERTFTNVQGVTVGLLFTILAAMVAVVTGLGTNGDAAGKGIASTFPWLAAAVPVVPLAILTYLQLQGTAAVVRSYYLRSLELEIRQLTERPDRPTLAATYTRTLLDIASLRRGRARYRLLTMAVVLVVIVVFGGLVVYIGFQVPWGQRITMIAVYAPAVLLLFREFWSVTIGGRRFWEELMAGRPHVEVPLTTPPVARSGRSLLSYLVLPRIEELIKLSFLGTGFLYGALAVGHVDRTLWTAFGLGLLVFEYLVYEARYQWNDLRGAAEDRQHAYAAQRRRLPLLRGSLRSSALVSAAVLAVRLVAAAGVCTWLVVTAPTYRATAIVLLAAGVAALLVAVVYEWARAARRPRVLWWSVGTGYGLRLALGTLLAVSVAEATGDLGLVLWIGLPALAFVTGWAIGTTSILMTWALESTASMWVPDTVLPALTEPESLSQARQNQRRRSDLPADARQHLVLDERLPKTKPHISGLAHTTDLLAGNRPRVAARPGKGWVSLDNLPLLQGALPRSMWNRTAVLAVALSAALGVSVALYWAVPGAAAPQEASRVWLLVAMAAVLGLVAGAIVTRCASSQARWVLWSGWAVVTVVGAGAAALWLADPSAGRVVLIALIAVGPSVFAYVANYALFRDASFRGLKHPFTPAAEFLIMVLLGRDTATVVDAERKAQSLPG